MNLVWDCWLIPNKKKIHLPQVEHHKFEANITSNENKYQKPV